MLVISSVFVFVSGFSPQRYSASLAGGPSPSAWSELLPSVALSGHRWPCSLVIVFVFVSGFSLQHCHCSSRRRPVAFRLVAAVAVRSSQRPPLALHAGYLLRLRLRFWSLFNTVAVSLAHRPSPSAWSWPLPCEARSGHRWPGSLVIFFVVVFVSGFSVTPSRLLSRMARRLLLDRSCRPP